MNGDRSCSYLSLTPRAQMDLDMGTLRYAINGTDLGFAYEDGFEAESYRPAVSLLDYSDSVAIRLSGDAVKVRSLSPPHHFRAFFCAVSSRSRDCRCRASRSLQSA